MFQYFGGPNIGWPENYMPVISANESQGEKRHTYTLCSYKTPKRVDKVFTTRESAMTEMYRICNSDGMQIVKVYDDKHDKTYFTNTGAEFHINRMF